MESHAHPDDGKHESLADLTAHLRHSARRVTGPRQAILELLRQERHPMTVREIHQHLGRSHCDQATVYRSLSMLLDLKLVQRFDFGDGAARFELTVGHKDHHHHLVCRACTRIVEVDDCFPEEFERALAARSGFKAVTHRLEFFGVCPDCQQGRRNRDADHENPIGD